MKTKQELSQEFVDTVQALQKECHEAVEGIMRSSNKPISVQDATNVFFYTKLAELQLDVNRLRNQVNVILTAHPGA